jgi:hypothetical protein
MPIFADSVGNTTEKTPRGMKKVPDGREFRRQK